MEQGTIKSFNALGPCNPKIHYMILFLERIPGLLNLINDGEYFFLHGPSQSGKTTILRSLTDKINEDGGDYALVCPLSSLISSENKDETFDIICYEFLNSCKI
jgi:predicted AAA+ superfamily ATPase